MEPHGQTDWVKAPFMLNDEGILGVIIQMNNGYFMCWNVSH